MYEIIIKRKVRTTEISNPEWKVIDQTLFTEAELTKMGYSDRQRIVDGGIEALKRNVFGHTPKIEIESVEEVEVFRQVVDELDFAAVVKAINKL